MAAAVTWVCDISSMECEFLDVAVRVSTFIPSTA
jgi:hypothetical protein